MTGSIVKTEYSQRGAVAIVEAAFVFPVMFIVLFLLIYLGNTFYVRSQVEADVVTYALRGADFCADPLLETIKENGGLPNVKDLKTEPYRYIFGGMNDVEKKIKSELESELKDGTATFFKNMKPNLRGGVVAKFNNYIVYSTFSVDLKYDIKFPIRFLGSDVPIKLSVSTRAEVPVNDSAEFIRNTDMVIDLLDSFKIGKGISDAFGKINEFLTSFAKK